ncbi:MAG TPA: hypothetical protein VFZ65_07460 [Planctomycetota bacterium]|nr:hypothetical protein [Planctomycetota bacterium]
MHRRASFVLFATFAGFATSPAGAQCAPRFAAGTGNMGFWSATGSAGVTATCVWDPDGPGPATPVLVFAGYFDVAGDARAQKLATLDPVTGVWAELGGGMPSYYSATSLLPMANGDLVAAGSFASVGGVPVNGIARWDGTTWHAYGNGLASGVRSVAVLPNGDLVACGDFYLGALSYLARWNGTAWTSLGAGVNAAVHAMAVLPNGDLIVGGMFNQAGGQPAARIARWDGTTWSAIPGLPQNPGMDAVEALAVMPNGDLIAALGWGVFRFDGVAWGALGSSVFGLSGFAGALLVLPNGDLIAGANAYLTSGVFNGVYRWDGTAWQTIGGACSGLVRCLALQPSGELIAGGAFAYAGTTRVDFAASWDGANWSPLSRGTTDVVFALAAAADGSHIAGGNFTTIGGVACNHVARWAAGTWSPLGGGVDGTVRAAVVLANGDVVVAGDFLAVSGLVARRVARWNGSGWVPLGGGCNGFVNALAVLPNGDLVAAGEFTLAGGVPANRIARWNGTTWAPLGAGIDYRALALHVLPNGDLLCGGEFGFAGGIAAQNVARWDGTAWSPLGNGVPFTVRALADRPGGELVAAGEAQPYGARIMAFDGTAWSSLPSGAGADNTITALASLPGGDLAAGGAFTTMDGAPASRIARWNGAAWSPLGAGLDATAHALAVTASGELLVGGEFTIADDAVAARVARLVSPCPATAPPVGMGCAGSAGTLDLVASSLPWLGASNTFVGSNLPANGLALGIVGFTPQALALNTVLPAAGPTCMLYATPDATLLLVPTAGSVTWQLAIPEDPSLVGLVLYAQVLGFEFGGAGLQSVASSNGLTPTIGSF